MTASRCIVVALLAVALTACQPDATPTETPPHYQSCADAQAAGDAPLKRGRDAGYRRALDGDGDGWACDGE
jgi:hypothetical protein